jgi:hypothetical protein
MTVRGDVIVPSYCSAALSQTLEMQTGLSIHVVAAKQGRETRWSSSFPKRQDSWSWKTVVAAEKWVQPRRTEVNLQPSRHRSSIYTILSLANSILEKTKAYRDRAQKGGVGLETKKMAEQLRPKRRIFIQLSKEDMEHLELMFASSSRTEAQQHQLYLWVVEL